MWGGDPHRDQAPSKYIGVQREIDSPTEWEQGRLNMTMQPSATLGSDVLVEKVSYKGFMHCDHPHREPNKTTCEGIHRVFQSKKQMKAAQSDNPLACRGFKKPVIMTVAKDGFRLDMLSSEQEGSLLHALTSKIVFATCIEKHIYVVTKRSTKPGKYACHCIKGEVKDEGSVVRIAKHLHDAATELRSEISADANQLSRDHSLMYNDKAAAKMREKVLAADPPSTPPPAGGANLTDYLGPVRNSVFCEDDLNSLSMSDFAALASETGEMSPSKLSSAKDAILNAMMWYHGTIGRDVADQRLVGKSAGTYLVRFSSNKNEYCISLVNTEGAVQHFATSTSAGMISLNGHMNTYKNIIDLIDHYSRHDITMKGDRCGKPLGKTKVGSDV